MSGSPDADAFCIDRSFKGFLRVFDRVSISSMVLVSLSDGVLSVHRVLGLRYFNEG